MNPTDISLHRNFRKRCFLQKYIYLQLTEGKFLHFFAKKNLVILKVTYYL